MQRSLYPKFNTNREYLASRLFRPQPPKLGKEMPKLNISVLPDYLQYIKNNLQKTQQITLSEYDLQTFLIEIATKSHPQNNFDKCTQKIIQHIRQHEQFWTHKTTLDDGKIKVAKQQYEKDLNQIKKQIKQSQSQQDKQSVPYKLIHQKLVPSDYQTVKQQTQITQIKFPLNVTLIPYAIDFSIKDSQCKAQKMQQRFKLYKQISEELLLGVKSKSKATNQNNYYERYYQTPQEKLWKEDGEKIINQFSEFLEELNVCETKSLSSAREYILIINIIRIINKFDKQLNQKNRQDCQVQEKNCKKQKEMGEQNSIMHEQANMNGQRQLQMQIQAEIEVNQQENQQQKVNKDYQQVMEQQQPVKNVDIKNLRQEICNKVFNAKELNKFIEYLFDEKQNNKEQLINIRFQKEQEQKKFMKQWNGFLNSCEEINQIQIQFQQMLEHPENTQQFKYKVHGAQVPWKQGQYKNFLIKFLQFYNVPTNNRKIALSMSAMPVIEEDQIVGETNSKNIKKKYVAIQPSHVKHVKGIYCRNMTQRIDCGQIGGGKKGIMDSKIDFLRRDIENFSMKWFKKDNNTGRGKGKGRQKNRKSKRSQRKRFNADYDEDLDSDY